MRHCLLFVLSLLAGFATTACAQEATVSELRVFPPAVNLATSKDRQLMVVQAVYSDGITRDVTAQAQMTFANPALVRREANTFWPAVDGATELKVEFAGKAVVVPVKVDKATVQRDISFKLDIMPIFMKTGCNSGSCHGAARGKDGFRMSLFGYDPDGDHYRLTREMSGRRVDLAVPAASLTVEKSIGTVPHTGGRRFTAESELNLELVRWIAAGCPQDPASIPTVTGVEIYPKQAVLDGEGDTQQVTVVTTYSDGSDRDVTGLALFLSNNDNSASINDDGLVKASARGEAFIMARFSTFTVGSQYIVLPKGLKFSFPPQQPVNYVDELVNAKLNKLRIAPSGICSDEAFLRRIYIDLVGLLPSSEEYTKFLADPARDKRAKLIDELVNRKEFTETWVGKWAEWLMIRTSNQITYKPMLLYYNWLSDQIGRNVPLDKMVQELLGASGGGEVAHPVGGRVMAPKFLGGEVAKVAGLDRRDVMAAWLASPQNPYFAQNFANRVWEHFVGVGIIEPVDDVRVSNPPSNPELIAELGKKFTSYNYDFKQLVKDICQSQAYQRATERNESNMTDERNFAHATLRRIKAESMLDCISQVTGTKDKFPGLPLGARATQIADGRTSTYFLTTFGRATRETACSCEVKMEPTLSQALHLLNGDTVNQKMASGGLIDKYLNEKPEPPAIVERFYIACLSRPPTPAEIENFKPLFAQGNDVKKGLEDVFWALMNSREFLFNH